jgi:hypothetical protein
MSGNACGSNENHGNGKPAGERKPETDIFGNEIWVTGDYGRKGKPLSMSKTVLGLFVYEVLRHGGRVTHTYAMDLYPRSYVQFQIALPPGKRTDLEKATGIALEDPPYLVAA